MKNFKRIIAMTIVAVMVMALIPFSVSAASVWSGGAAASFESGTGTENDPYIIATANQLAYLASLNAETPDACTGKYFKLTSDIDLANLDWTPIGNSTVAFGGHFDGDGHTISGLNFNVEDSNGGLFGKISSATVKNLTVEGPLASSSKYVGGVVGLMSSGSSVINCHSKMELVSAKGAVEEGTTGLGGVVGRSEKANSNGDYNIIANCTSEANVGEVTGVLYTNSYIGGVVGVAGATVIIGCQNTGNVIGQATSKMCTVGGILGCMGASSGEVILLLNSSSGKLIAYRSADATHAYVGGIASRVGHVTGGIALGNYSDAEVYTYEDGTETLVDNRYGGLFGYIKGVVSAYYNYSVNEPLVGEDSTNKFSESGAIKTTSTILEGSDVFTETKIPDTALKAAAVLVEASVKTISIKVEDDDIEKINATLEGKNVYEYVAEQLLKEYSIDGAMTLAEVNILGGMPVASSVENSVAFAKYAEKLLNNSYEKVEELAASILGDETEESTQEPEPTQEPDATTKAPEPTREPDATTKAPAQTEEPGTDKPADSKGCKSVVVSGVAVVLMAAAAVVALKKKD